MAHIKFNINGTTYSTWNHTTKLTTPSLILNENGTLRYTPLFAVNNGAEAILYDYWYFKCGALAVTHNNTKYHVAISRRYMKTVSRTISTTITHSGKTGTTTTTTSKTVTPSGSHSFGTRPVSPGSSTISDEVTVSYGVTFSSIPSIYINYGGTLVSKGSSSCVIRMSITAVNSGTSTANINVGSSTYKLTVTGNVSTTTTTYPNETKSAVAQGNFDYGVTYPSAPTLTVNSGGISASNNSGNKSFLAKKTLSGTVAYNKSATLSQTFSVTFNGNFGLS